MKNTLYVFPLIPVIIIAVMLGIMVAGPYVVQYGQQHQIIGR